MTATINPDRLAKVQDITLGTGSHSPLPPGKDPYDNCMCLEEMMAWVCELEWTDHPGLASPVIEAFGRAFNDRTDAAGRKALKDWKIANFSRLLATVDDGLDQQRGYFAADWAIRVSLPVWLEIAGATEAAAELRALPEITSADLARSSRDKVRVIRGRAPLVGARDRLYKKVYEAVKKRLEDKGYAAAYAAAYADADAAYAAYAAAYAYAAYADAAYADADAAYADADAYADAAYADAAYADADADAYAAADAAYAYADAYAAAYADAYADAAGAGGSLAEIRRAAREAMKAKLTELFDAKRAEAGIKPVKESAIDLLEAMVSIGEAA